MDKRAILREIRRIHNGDFPLGQRRSEVETGIKEHVWRGRHWARWSDALRDAGFEPNAPNQTIDDQVLLEGMIALIRRLQRAPTWAEWEMEHRSYPTFPSRSAFRRAGLGTLAELHAKLVEYCEDREGFDDILLSARSAAAPDNKRGGEQPREGSVYLIKSGRHYKIGRAFEIGRRAREIALQLPERAVSIHIIRTDDPIGIEVYWHKRFEAKRANGGWFALTTADVQAFKRRKTFM